MSKKMKNWIFVILWAGIIFFFSHQTGLKSGLPSQWDFILRKTAHISEYFVLSFLVFNALSQHYIKKNKVLFYSFLFSFIYAVSDEYHQTFISERNGNFYDVLIDSIGILLFILTYKLFHSKKKKDQLV